MTAHLMILGGGPAGAAAAIYARTKGLRVTLLDQARKPRKLPGETVAPGIESLLKLLGVWESVEANNFLRHSGIWRVDLHGARCFVEYGKDESEVWQGLQLNRLEFHEILRYRAMELGVDWHDSRPIKLLEYSQDGWLIESASGHMLRSTILIDASGTNSWLAKQFRLPTLKSSVASRVLYGWKPREAVEPDANPVFKEMHDGWEWSAPITDDQIAWVRLKFGEHGRGFEMTPRIRTHCAGENWFLVGDAACLTTPASGNGVLRALMSGIFAAHLSAAILSAQVPSRDCAAAYRQWMLAFWKSSVEQTIFSPRILTANSP